MDDAHTKVLMLASLKAMNKSPNLTRSWRSETNVRAAPERTKEVEDR
jgi:hypothetical protein